MSSEDWVSLEPTAAMSVPTSPTPPIDTPPPQPPSTTSAAADEEVIVPVPPPLPPPRDSATLKSHIAQKLGSLFSSYDLLPSPTESFEKQADIINSLVRNAESAHVDHAIGRMMLSKNILQELKNTQLDAAQKKTIVRHILQLFCDLTVVTPPNRDACNQWLQNDMETFLDFLFQFQPDAFTAGRFARAWYGIGK